jgi:hypothetical protein
MPRPASLLALLLLAPVPASADEVFLQGGGHLRGVVVVSRSDDALVVEVGPGRLTLPMSRVERIVEASSALATYRDRAARLAPDDLNGWLALGIWAQERDLLTPAHAAFQHVVALDPTNAAAQSGLGRVPLNGQWVSEEESYRARGYVPFEGRWITPADRDALVRGRRESDLARRAEAEARAREAAARAREAEAEARRAQADRSGAEEGGIPLGYVTGYVRGGFGRVVPPRHPRHTPPPVATPTPAPAPPPPAPRVGPGAKSASAGLRRKR